MYGKQTSQAARLRYSRARRDDLSCHPSHCHVGFHVRAGRAGIGIQTKGKQVDFVLGLFGLFSFGSGFVSVV